MMNAARAVEMEIFSRSRGVGNHGKNDVKLGTGQTIIKPVSNYGARINPYGHGASGHTNVPGPNGGRVSDPERDKGGAKSRGTKHLPYQTLMERKQKGLCFKCGGSYGPIMSVQLNS
jgi:hypothetical protein